MYALVAVICRVHEQLQKSLCAPLHFSYFVTSGIQHLAVFSSAQFPFIVFLNCYLNCLLIRQAPSKQQWRGRASKLVRNFIIGHRRWWDIGIFTFRISHLILACFQLQWVEMWLWTLLLGSLLPPSSPSINVWPHLLYLGHSLWVDTVTSCVPGHTGLHVLPAYL